MEKGRKGMVKSSGQVELVVTPHGSWLLLGAGKESGDSCWRDKRLGPRRGNQRKVSC